MYIKSSPCSRACLRAWLTSLVNEPIHEPVYGFGASQLGIKAKVKDYLGNSVGVDSLGIRINRA